MDMQQTIRQAEQDIRQAISDYRRHTRMTDVLDSVSEDFIHNLARDSTYAKQSSGSSSGNLPHGTNQSAPWPSMGQGHMTLTTA